MNRLGDAILQPILDGRGAQEEEVVLDDLSRLVQLICASAANRRRRRVEDLVPFLELLLGNLAHRQAKRPQTLRCIFFEVTQGGLDVRVLIAQPLENHRVGALAVAADLAIGASINSGHPLSGRVELAHSQELILQLLPARFNNHRFWLAGGELVS